MSRVASERVRVGITMTARDHEDIKALAESEGTTVSGLLRRAVTTHRYLKDRQSAGARVLVEQAGVQTEVVFR